MDDHLLWRETTVVGNVLDHLSREALENALCCLPVLRREA